MIFPWRSSAQRQPPPSIKAHALGPTAPAERHPGLPIMAADALLKPRSTAVAEIQELCGFPKEHFSALVMPLLRSVAEWCQAFPASEAHHHARPFGLLDHTLEVAILALRLRRGILLPEGATAETLAEYQDRWTYGVLAAALIHDLGKPAIDQTVTLYARGRPTGETWNPWAGPVTKIQADAYLAHYRKEPLPQGAPPSPARSRQADVLPLVGAAAIRAVDGGRHEPAGRVDRRLARGGRRLPGRDRGPGR